MRFAASVTMNEGSPVLVTSRPFASPTMTAAAPATKEAKTKESW